jgi:hypothetical protein
MSDSAKEKVFSDSRSLNRPAWTQNDLHAYRHKHVMPKNSSDPAILRDYYVKSNGEE